MMKHSNREQMVKQIIETMDCEYAQGDESTIWVHDGMWQVFLPDLPENQVAIKISQKLPPAVAIDIGIRFSGAATLMGLNTTFNGVYDPNSDATGVVLIQED